MRGWEQRQLERRRFLSEESRQRWSVWVGGLALVALPLLAVLHWLGL